MLISVNVFEHAPNYAPINDFLMNVLMTYLCLYGLKDSSCLIDMVV